VNRDEWTPGHVAVGDGPFPDDERDVVLRPTCGTGRGHGAGGPSSWSQPSDYQKQQLLRSNKTHTKTGNNATCLEFNELQSCPNYDGQTQGIFSRRKIGPTPFLEKNVVITCGIFRQFLPRIFWLYNIVFVTFAKKPTGFLISAILLFLQIILLEKEKNPIEKMKFLGEKAYRHQCRWGTFYVRKAREDDEGSTHRICVAIQNARGT